MPQQKSTKTSLHPDEFELWLKSVELHEAPVLYTRWAVLFGVSAMMQRNVYVEGVYSKTYPNLMTFFVGPPASRKSTVIGYLREMLFQAGHVDFCPQDMTKNALINELAGHGSAKKRMKAYSAKMGYSADPFDILNGTTAQDINISDLMDNADEDVNVSVCNSLTILSDELQTQFQRPAEVLSVLQDLYDCKPSYSFRAKTVFNPFVCMMSAVNTETLPVIFDHSRLLNGFLSRIILIHSPNSGRKFNPFLAVGEMPAIKPMAGLYKRIKSMQGGMSWSEGAMQLYKTIELLPQELLMYDIRFDAYMQRRMLHLTKVSMCQALLNGRMEIATVDVAYAHTLLCYTEANMPDALGEYGFSKMSGAQQAVLNALHEATLSGSSALSSTEILPRVQHYVGTMEELANVLNHLVSVRAIKKIGNDVDTGGDARIKYQRVKADLGRWSTQFSKTVFPQLMPEWAKLLGNSSA